MWIIAESGHTVNIEKCLGIGIYDNDDFREDDDYDGLTSYRVQAHFAADTSITLYTSDLLAEAEATIDSILQGINDEDRIVDLRPHNFEELDSSEEEDLVLKMVKKVSKFS